MSRLFDGTNDSLRSPSAFVASLYNKATVCFWLWWDAFANDGDQALEHTPSIDSNSGGFLVQPNAPSGFLELSMQGLVGYSTARYTRPSAAAWHHYACIFDLSVSTNEVDLYLDGVLQTPASRPANSNNTNAFTDDFFNVMSRDNSSRFGAGRMAELIIYFGEVLNAREAAALAGGVNPRRIRPTSNPVYWPLWGLHSPEICLRRPGFETTPLTVNGAVTAAHAPVRPFTWTGRPTAPLIEEAAPGGFQPAWARGANRLVGGGLAVGG